MESGNEQNLSRDTIATQTETTATQSNKIDKSKKRLFICCDGTWQNAASSNPGYSGYSTNVARFARCVHRLEPNTHETESGTKDVVQVVWYSGGIGTYNTSKLGGYLAAFTGAGITSDILDAYYFLSSNYNFGYQEDEIILIGYSRGAFTVRCLAAFISKVGLLRRVALPFLGLLFQYWNEGKNADAKLNALREKLMADELGLLKEVDITVLAEFDPVGTTFGEGEGIDSVQNSSTVPCKVQNAFLAMALNEERSSFKPLVWKEKHPDRLVKQCAFLGCHGDIGGGNEDSGLSQLPLLWMIAQIQQATSTEKSEISGALFDEEQLLQFASPSSVGMDGDRLTFKTFSSAEGQIGKTLTASWKLVNLAKYPCGDSHPGHERADIIKKSLRYKNAEEVISSWDYEAKPVTNRHYNPVHNRDEEISRDKKELRSTKDCWLRIHFSVRLLKTRSRLGDQEHEDYYDLGPLKQYEPTQLETHVWHWTRSSSTSTDDPIDCLEEQAQCREETYLLEEWVRKADQWWNLDAAPTDQNEEERNEKAEAHKWRELIKIQSATPNSNTWGTLVYFFKDRIDRDELRVREDFAQKRRNHQAAMMPSPGGDILRL